MNRKINLNDTIPYPKEKDSKIPIGRKTQEIKCKPISKGIPRVINIEKHKINNHIEETVGPDPKPNKIALPILLRQVSRQSSRQSTRQSTRQNTRQSPIQNTRQNTRQSPRQRVKPISRQNQRQSPRQNPIPGVKPISRQNQRQNQRQSPRQNPIPSVKPSSRQYVKASIIKNSPYINKIKKPIKKIGELPIINQNKKELPRCISQKYIVKESKTVNNEEKEDVKNLPDVIKETPRKKDLRVSALNDIQKEKSYVKIFLEQEEINSKRYYYIDQGIRNRNELLVCTKIPDESDVTYFNLMIYFDKYDDVDITFETDPEFFDSLFYSEVIITQRYKEAWQIIRQKYQEMQWIHKFIHFLLAAPPIIPLLME